MPAVSPLPVHPSMSHILMMNNIRDDDAGLGRGYCPSLLYPLRLGRICKIANRRLKAPLPRLKAPNRTGWKVTTNSVAASRFGQQKVSSRGDAMMDRRREERGGRESKENGLPCQEKEDKGKKMRGNARVHDPTLWEITGLNHHVLPFNPCGCSLTVSYNTRIRQSTVVWEKVLKGGDFIICLYICLSIKMFHND